MVSSKWCAACAISAGLLIFSTACTMAPAHESVKSEASPPREPSAEKEAAAPIMISPNAAENTVASSEDVKEKAAPAAVIEHAAPVETVQAPKVISATPVFVADTNSKQVDPETSLRWLQHGNVRYVKHSLRADGAGLTDRDRLTAGQHPHAVILACSDSRVPPEIVFDQKLGEVLVVRTAGEAIDHTALASIEDAVEHLGARLVLVLGHESCDMVQAAIKPGDQAALSPAMSATLDSIKTRFAQTEFVNKDRDVASTLDMTKASEANATGAAHDLMKQSEILKRMVASGQVQIHSALYHMKTGAVTFY